MSRRSRPIRKTVAKRKGAVLVLTAVFLVISLAFLAFAFDFGYIVVTDSELQNAADAGAMSGARALRDGRKTAVAAAQAWAGKNFAAGTAVAVPETDVEIGLWNNDTAIFTPLPTNSTVSPNAVRVFCRRSAQNGNPQRLFWGPLLGKDSANLNASSTAYVSTSICGLFIGIDKVTLSGGSYTDSYNSSIAPYDSAAAGNEGHVCSDGPITLSGPSYVDGNALPGQDSSVSTSGSSYVTGSTNPRSEPLDLPPVDFGNTAAVNDNDNIPESDDEKQPYDEDSGKFVLSGNDHVSLPPGVYHFSQFTLSGGSGITVTGPTVIYCVGKFMASGGSIANTTGIPANLQVYCTGDKVHISGGSHFYGMIYAPSSKVVRSSRNGHLFGSAIGKELTLTGGGGAHADTALELNGSGAGVVLLVE